MSSAGIRSIHNALFIYKNNCFQFCKITFDRIYIYVSGYSHASAKKNHVWILALKLLAMSYMSSVSANMTWHAKKTKKNYYVPVWMQPTIMARTLHFFISNHLWKIIHAIALMRQHIRWAYDECDEFIKRSVLFQSFFFHSLFVHFLRMKWILHFSNNVDNKNLLKRLNEFINFHFYNK